jgi:hypothetical protein
MNETLEEQLLHASLLCGMKPDGTHVYRLQLFFIANKDLGSNSHQADFQRSLQTGVSKGLWKDFRTNGEYEITLFGYNTAKERFGNVQPRYVPTIASEYRCRLVGYIEDIKVEIETFGNDNKSTTVIIDGEPCRSSKKACQILENRTSISLPTGGESAVRVLYNMAIDYNFELYLEGEILQFQNSLQIQHSFEKPIPEEEDEEAFPEGKEVYTLHRSKERKAKVVDLAKKRKLKNDPLLHCQVCNFSFIQAYGKLGEGFIEAHHTIPLSEFVEETETRVEDIALVCSNCHKMLHRHRPWLRIPELSNLLNSK